MRERNLKESRLNWGVGAGRKGREKQKGIGQAVQERAPNPELQERMGTKRGTGSHGSAQAKWLSLCRKENLGEGRLALGKERFSVGGGVSHRY